MPFYYGKDAAKKLTARENGLVQPKIARYGTELPFDGGVGIAFPGYIQDRYG